MTVTVITDDDCHDCHDDRLMMTVITFSGMSG